MVYRNFYRIASQDEEFLNDFLESKHTPDNWEDNPDQYTLLIICSLYLGYIMSRDGVVELEDIISKCKIDQKMYI